MPGNLPTLFSAAAPFASIPAGAAETCRYHAAMKRAVIVGLAAMAALVARAIPARAGGVSIEWTAPAACGSAAQLLGQVADADPSADGIEPACRAYDVVRPRTVEERRTELRACDGNGALPCFRVVADPATCGDTDTGLAVQVDRDGPAPAGAHVVLECQ